MGVGAAATIEAQLKAMGIAEHVQATLVSNAQRADQSVATCSGDCLSDCVATSDIANPAIIFLRLSHADFVSGQRDPIQTQQNISIVV
jgi:siroheme synthase